MFSEGFSFNFSAIVSCKANHVYNGDNDDPGLDIRFVGIFCLSEVYNNQKF